MASSPPPVHPDQSRPSPNAGTADVPPPSGNSSTVLNINPPAVHRHGNYQHGQVLPPVNIPSPPLPSFHIRHPSAVSPARSPTAAALHIRPDASASSSSSLVADSEPAHDLQYETLSPPVSSGQKYPSMKSSLSAMSIASAPSPSPGSAISSPALAAMTDITPLPSPLLPGESPGPWKRPLSRPASAGSVGSVKESDYSERKAKAPMPGRSQLAKQKKLHGGIAMQTGDDSSADTAMRRNEHARSRHRSFSEYVPGALQNMRPRNVTIASAQAVHETGAASESDLHREKYLAEQRGIVSSSRNGAAPLPTPPPSNRSVTESECDDFREEEQEVAHLTVRFGPKKRKRQYRPIRPLGQGTFSKVLLATDQQLPAKSVLNEASEPTLDPKHLVAIKVIEHGPAGGADEERVELSLKREVELLQRLSHPSLVHLQAFDFDNREALLVLDYCPGGDLFDLASAHREVLRPAIVQRMFAELVGAVAYLHSQWIVHRDIKLENVLVNVHVATLLSIVHPAKYPHPLITLTDLGLSREIPQPPTSPLLHTRCGSEDYAAPEILLSQPYDGRATDAWALGVLLYALMEGRLPFDAPPARPGMKVARGRSKAAHRIARCEWMWCRFGDDSGDWDHNRGIGWEGARECVEGLLRKVSRGRLTVPALQETEYVKDGIQVPGGLKREHDQHWEDDPEDIPEAVEDADGDIKMAGNDPFTTQDQHGGKTPTEIESR